jgi:hypothetical protein
MKRFLYNKRLLSIMSKPYLSRTTKIITVVGLGLGIGINCLLYFFGDRIWKVPPEYSEPIKIERTIDVNQPDEPNQPDIKEALRDEPFDFTLPYMPSIDAIVMELESDDITSLLKEGIPGSSEVLTNARVLATANNGSCVYGLYDSDPNDLKAGLFVDSEWNRAHLFHRSLERNYDFDSFSISDNGQICRLMTNNVVILYDINSLEPIDMGYGRRKATSPDGRVVIFSYHNLQVSSNIKGTTYFILDENDNKVFPFSTSTGGDTSDFVLSEYGSAFASIKHHPSGSWYFDANKKENWGYNNSRNQIGIKTSADPKDIVAIDEYGKLTFSVFSPGAEIGIEAPEEIQPFSRMQHVRLYDKQDPEGDHIRIRSMVAPSDVMQILDDGKVTVDFYAPRPVEIPINR